MTDGKPITAECLTCKRKFDTMFVSLMGHTFLAERYCPLCLEQERRVTYELGGRGKMEEIAVIAEVTRKSVTPKSGGEQFTLYEIEAGDHKWATKRQELALTAHSLVGRPALITGKVKQNGSYTNYYLDSIQETDRTVTPSEDVFAEPSNGNGASDIRNTTDDRQQSIHRQVATKVAAALTDNAYDFWQNVDLLMSFYETGNHPGENNATTVAAAATQFTGDDDIPF